VLICPLPYSFTRCSGNSSRSFTLFKTWLICKRIFFKKMISLFTSLSLSEQGHGVAHFVETQRYSFSQNWVLAMLPGGSRRPVPTADNLTTFMCRVSWNVGSSTFWHPQGLPRPLQGSLYLPDRTSVSVRATAALCSPDIWAAVVGCRLTDRFLWLALSQENART
jgi:hypothetical protein